MDPVAMPFRVWSQNWSATSLTHSTPAPSRLKPKGGRVSPTRPPSAPRPDGLAQDLRCLAHQVDLARLRLVEVDELERVLRGELMGVRFEGVGLGHALEGVVHRQGVQVLLDPLPDLLGGGRPSVDGRPDALADQAYRVVALGRVDGDDLGRPSERGAEPEEEVAPALQVARAREVDVGEVVTG